MSYITECRILTGSCKCIFILFIYTFSNICNDKEELFVYIKYCQNCYKQNLLKMLGNNVNDKASPFKLILVYDVITAHVSLWEFLS